MPRMNRGPADVFKGKGLRGCGVDDLRDLYEVEADEALDGEDGGEVVGGVLKEEEPRGGVGG